MSYLDIIPGGVAENDDTIQNEAAPPTEEHPAPPRGFVKQKVAAVSIIIKCMTVIFDLKNYPYLFLCSVSTCLAYGLVICIMVSNVTHLISFSSFCQHRVVLSFAVCSDFNFLMDSKPDSLSVFEKKCHFRVVNCSKRFASGQFPWNYSCKNNITGLLFDWIVKEIQNFDRSICLSVC